MVKFFEFSKNAFVCLLVVGWFLTLTDRASAISYQGIYVILDIYQGPGLAGPNGTDISLLQVAAAPSYCTTSGSRNNKTFCGSATGVLLDVHWCEWEPDSTSMSCGSGVKEDGKHAVSFGEVTTACDTQKYDNCHQPASPISACSYLQSAGGSGDSTLGAALYYICKINLNRLAVGLSPLNLSVGLDAGVYTPASVIATAGYVDEPGTLANSTTYICGRQPQVWGTGYVGAYEAALKALITYIAQFDAQYVDSQGMTHNTTSPITILKVTGLGQNTLELVQYGPDTFPAIGNVRQSFTKPSSLSALPDCSYVDADYSPMPLTPAQNWLQQYSATPIGGGSSDTMIQAMQHVFGRIVGYDYALLMNMSASKPTIIPSSFVLSIGARNSSSMPEVNCGKDGTATCIGQNEESPNAIGDQWTTWYPETFSKNLFPNANGAYTFNTSGAAAVAEAANQSPAVTYDLLNSQLALDITNLQSDQTAYPSCSLTDCPALAVMELPCNLNNVTMANEGEYALTLTLNGSPSMAPFIGVGAAIAWQTAQADFQDCDPVFSGSNPPEDTYSMDDLEFGVYNGGQFIEISSTEASTSSCQAVLPTIIGELANQTQPPSKALCLYQ